MVAPTSKTASPWDPSLKNKFLRGNVSELLGRAYAQAKMAPDLHSFIRAVLESQQVQTQDINSFLSQHPSLKRYNSAFKLLWGLAVERQINLLTTPLPQLAALILNLHQVSPSQARNAYSELILIPGLDQLRFSPLLTKCKKLWSDSSAKYGIF